MTPVFEFVPKYAVASIEPISSMLSMSDAPS